MLNKIILTLLCVILIFELQKQINFVWWPAVYQGTVMDEQGQPIPGAHVVAHTYQEGTSGSWMESSTHKTAHRYYETQSDQEGQFKIIFDRSGLYNKRPPAGLLAVKNDYLADVRERVRPSDDLMMTLKRPANPSQYAGNLHFAYDFLSGEEFAPACAQHDIGKILSWLESLGDEFSRGYRIQTFPEMRAQECHELGLSMALDAEYAGTDFKESNWPKQTNRPPWFHGGRPFVSP